VLAELGDATHPEGDLWRARAFVTAACKVKDRTYNAWNRAQHAA